MADEPSIKQSLLKEKQSLLQASRQIKYFLPNIFSILVIAVIALSIIIWDRLNTAQLKQSVFQVRTELQQMQTQVQRDIAANRNKITQFIHQAGKTTLQQALVKATYLIWLAHVQLMIDNNPTLAIRLLKIAQQSLQSLPLDTVPFLTQAINQDVVALSDVPKINILELSDRLAQLKLEIDNLLVQSKVIPPKESDTTSPFPTTQWLEKIKYSYLGGLKNLFVIRRIDHPPFPLSEPRQILFLKENLQLKLVEAQWALFNRNSLLYQKSLKTAVQWLADYSSNQPELAEIIKKIQALAVIDITPVMPTLQSLQTINRLVIGKTRGTKQ